MKWNKEQIELINSVDGVVFCVAGSGSGKSTTAVERTRHMVEDCKIPQKDICMLSFTNNSANDLKAKLKSLNLGDVKVGTLHSICNQILRNHGHYLNFNIKQYEVENLFNKYIEDSYECEVGCKYDEIMGWIQFQKAYGKTPKSKEFKYKESKYTITMLRDCFKIYEDYKKKNGCSDFADILLLCYSLGRIRSIEYCKYLTLDECQDVSLIQHKLIDMICPKKNILLIGDYRQSMYSFNGATPDVFMDTPLRYKDCKVINLYTNYRSTRTIVEESNNFIKNYYSDYEYYMDSKSYSEIDSEIKKNTYDDEYAEAKSIREKIQEITKEDKESKIYILYRNNVQSSYLQNELLMNNISFKAKDNGNFFKRKELACIIDCLRLIQNLDDDGAVRDLMDKRAGGFMFLSKQCIQDIKAYAKTHKVSLLNALTKCGSVRELQLRWLNLFTREIIKLHEDTEMTLEDKSKEIIEILELKEFIETKYKSEEEIEDRKKGLDCFISFTKDRKLEDFLTYAMTNEKKKDNENEQIEFLTIHSSKGLEAEIVFVIGCKEGTFPSVKNSMIEEANIFYVGITRAKKELYVSSIGGSSFVSQMLVNK